MHVLDCLIIDHVDDGSSGVQKHASTSAACLDNSPRPQKKVSLEILHSYLHPRHPHQFISVLIIDTTGSIEEYSFNLFIIPTEYLFIYLFNHLLNQQRILQIFLGISSCRIQQLAEDKIPSKYVDIRQQEETLKI